MKALYAQFREPSGLLGWLVGQSMGLKNAARSRWVLGLLAAKPGEQVLEIGFGSGSDILRLNQAVAPTGSVCGVDASETMVTMATRRNRRAIREGGVRLMRGTMPNMPWQDSSFDAVYSVNCAQFWPELEPGIAAIGRVLRVGGRVAIAVQPKHRGASRADAERWHDKLCNAGAQAGLTVVACKLGPEPVPTAAVVLRKEQG